MTKIVQSQYFCHYELRNQENDNQTDFYLTTNFRKIQKIHVKIGIFARLTKINMGGVKSYLLCVSLRLANGRKGC